MDISLQDKIEASKQQLEVLAESMFSDNKEELMALSNHLDDPIYIVSIVEGVEFGRNCEKPGYLIDEHVSTQETLHKSITDWLDLKSQAEFINSANTESDRDIQEFCLRLEEKIIDKRAMIKTALARVVGIGLGMVQNPHLRNAVEKLMTTNNPEQVVIG